MGKEDSMNSRTKIVVLVAALMLVGCKDDKSVSTPITMTVVDTYEDTAPMGCIGTNWNTLVRSDDGKTEKMCGRYGKVGDKISGCWVTGSYDPYANGFRRVCQ